MIRLTIKSYRKNGDAVLLTFKGDKISEDDKFITIFDIVTQQQKTFNKEVVMQVDNLEANQ